MRFVEQKGRNDVERASLFFIAVNPIRGSIGDNTNTIVRNHER